MFMQHYAHTIDANTCAHREWKVGDGHRLNAAVKTAAQGHDGSRYLLLMVPTGVSDADTHVIYVQDTQSEEGFNWEELEYGGPFVGKRVHAMKFLGWARGVREAMIMVALGKVRRREEERRRAKLAGEARAVAEAL